jgi:hypothetical protein
MAACQEVRPSRGQFEAEMFESVAQNRQRAGAKLRVFLNAFFDRGYGFVF